MLFSLWLIALVLAAEARTLTDDAITFEDTTALPALDTSDLPADISTIVDMKAVLLDGDTMMVSEQEEEEEDGVETATEYLVVDGASIPIQVDRDTDDDDAAAADTAPHVLVDGVSVEVDTEAPDALQVFQVVQKLEELPTDDIPLITTTSPEELSRQEELELHELATSLGEADILDVISNFIADKDPMLQLFLSICFVHPDCYQAAPPAATRLEEADLASLSPLARDLADNLRNRRTEAARNLLVAALSNVQERVTRLMFKHIELGVGARGVSVAATKNIIDAVKNIWVSVSGDLEYAKSAVQEVFYTLDLGPEKEAALVQLADTVLAVPARVEQLFSQATQEGYKDYVRHSSWDSWKRAPRDV